MQIKTIPQYHLLSAGFEGKVGHLGQSLEEVPLGMAGERVWLCQEDAGEGGRARKLLLWEWREEMLLVNKPKALGARPVSPHSLTCTCGK